ncbi:hypothetical protein [Leptolyngbya iicbica]|uniref:Uncharacterized protein n=2 Tax=Cyanophyceae TaxID=3028117 RepID=A0A4V2E3B6_9CYAN|nr:hypothetical protein [Leptolyngbya sp. LK]RZM81870.1 hypothetical protein DYY88_00925 [Leptolyngbya sp. LK]
MDNTQFVQLSALPGWIIGVSHNRQHGYQCWLINSALDVLNDGYEYSTSSAALMAGRSFIERQYEA